MVSQLRGKPEVTGETQRASANAASAWSISDLIAADCSAAEKQALFPGTATNYYRLG